jgi:hypothetical protein
MRWQTLPVLALWCAAALAQQPASISPPANTKPASSNPGPVHTATALYRQLCAARLDPDRLYSIREAHIDREDLHLSLDKGTIAFTHAIDGRVTGAYFRGEGQVLLSPPDRVERASLGRFTGAAILDEVFTSAYLRFNDDTLAELEPNLSRFQPAPAVESGSASAEVSGTATDADAMLDDADLAEEEPAEASNGPVFLQRGDAVFAALSPMSAPRLFVTFVNAEGGSSDGSSRWQQPPGDRFLHVRLAGSKLGVFDVYFDSRMAEQIVVAQSHTMDGLPHYDEWTSFPMRSVRARVTATQAGVSPASTSQTQTAAERVSDPARIVHYRIKAEVRPPHSLEAEARLEVQVEESGNRILVFELSRFLQVKEAEMDGRPLEFLQNESLQGPALAQRGNDVVTVVFPAPLAAGQVVHLRLVYGGDVLSDAGGGLMYVGARGIWYPNLGPAMSNFDMEFRYPSEWTLLATGKRVAPPASVPGTSDLSVHYVSERPMPFAGFNLGRYVKAEARADAVHIESYAARSLENRLTLSRDPVPPLIDPLFSGRVAPSVPIKSPPEPNPSEHVQRVADTIAEDIRFLSGRLGPFPYSELAITQMPGSSSQSWPGLVYLSGLSFLSSDERARVQNGSFDDLTYHYLMPAHEAAHQWWGDLLLWSSYREQWVVEALSNYCALLMLEQRDPAASRLVLERYRRDLAGRNQEDEPVSDAGPVTLGIRLNSSHFPTAYDLIAYERGTWLFHMLRSMLLDAVHLSGTVSPSEAGAEKASAGSIPSGETAVKNDIPASGDPFFAVLRTLRQRFEGQAVSTRDVQQAFEEVLPPALRYEGRKSLEWFFDGWVNGTALPVLRLENIKFLRQGSGLLASGKIVQRLTPADLITSVPVYAQVPGRKPFLLGRVFAEGAETQFRLPAPMQTRRILLDPFGTVLTRP